MLLVAGLGRASSSPACQQVTHSNRLSPIRTLDFRLSHQYGTPRHLIFCLCFQINELLSYMTLLCFGHDNQSYRAADFFSTHLAKFVDGMSTAHQNTSDAHMTIG